MNYQNKQIPHPGILDESLTQLSLSRTIHETVWFLKNVQRDQLLLQSTKPF